ncbi:WXG100 family type VII secretion target [Bacillus cereus group sp. N6]|uniref:WXG100 family type VII secretion target n=1 Tax=Bacillus cereus group sp. N6 TaxID=2794583 RepID=UPI0018F75FD2|nr:WXG100 family type VII secretion target [Bacillus cereus group sp. N6]MBJ8113335.1 WXG100 family type VII secretion target [Bacillus cereus group sp. N6]
MLLNEIKVPPEELERISKNFHHAGIEAKMKHENLKKDIDMLYNSWYGLSSQHFFIAFNLSRGILDTYVDKLEYIEKKLAQIAEKFRNTDESYIFEESSNLLKTSKDYIESGLYGDTLTYEVTGEIPKNFDSIPSKLLAGEQIGGDASYGSLGIAAGGKVSSSGGEAHGSLGVGPFGLGFKLGVNKHN